MEVTYKRDRGHNYILFPGKKEAGTQTEMIRRNQIPGLADFYTEWEDNQRYYGYDITGAKPLRQMLEVRPFTRKEAEGLIEELAGIFQRMESFLLDRDKLVLKPELLYVYADRQGYVCSDRQGFLFFFCEEQEGSCREHLRELALYLFEKADEEDRELTELLFRLYRLLAQGEPEAEELLGCLRFQRPGTERAEPFPDRVAEGRPEELYGGGRQTGNPEEHNGKKSRLKRNLFTGKKEVLAKLFGKGTEEEMWDDLEPAGILGRREEAADQGVQRPAGREEEETKNAAAGTDHPTEILYTTEDRGGIPCLVEQEKKKRILLLHFPFYIGTQPGMDYCPEFQGISRIHLKLERRGSDVWITDLNSTNGTALNGEPMRPNEERKLENGDRIWLAGLVYEFDSGNESW